MPLNLDVIQGLYFSDLLDQPRALEATWSSLCNTPAFGTIASACTPDRFPRAVLTGMGSSYFGLHPLSIELAAQGWTPLMLETSELIHYYPHLLVPGTLAVAVSQSGRSAETLRLLEMNSRRATVIGLSNDAGSPLAQHSDFAVLTAAGKEYSVSCKTYTAAQMALRVLAAALCGLDCHERLAALAPAAEAVSAYLHNWRDHVADFAELLGDARDLFLVGRGASLAAASTGALTIKESDHFHAEGMSSAAFRHGPFEMLQRGIVVGVFAGDPTTRALNDSLFQDLSRTPAKAVRFAEDADLAACRLPAVSEWARPIVEILPAQMITLALAAIAGREPGKFERATKITAVE